MSLHVLCVIEIASFVVFVVDIGEEGYLAFTPADLSIEGVSSYSYSEALGILMKKLGKEKKDV
jgi:hypothetical protein